MPIRSRWTNQFKQLPNQSEFHEKTRRILCTNSFLKGLKCYQEVPVKDLCPGYAFNHYFDWYIEELYQVVELHGAQHYKVVNYGNISFEAAQKQFKDIQHRDALKKEAALNQGLKYTEIPYKDYSKLNEERLLALLLG